MVIMQNFVVAVIEPKKITLEYDTLDTCIKDCITYHETSLDNMMELIVNVIKLDSKMIGDTVVCFENEKYVFQLCHLNMEDNGQKNSPDDINTLASTLTLGGQIVYKNCVLLCSQITDAGTCAPTSISEGMILELLKNKMRHKCMLLKTDGTTEELTFVRDPMETVNNAKDYQWMELPFMKHNLIMYLQNNPVTDTVNKLATKLVGTDRVHGDCVLVSKSAENEYLNVDKELLDKFLKLSEGPVSSRQLREEEKESDKKINGLPIAMNRSCVLERRLQTYKQICHNCNETIDLQNSKVCSGCYRVRYHNEACRVAHWPVHKEHCLYNKPNMNKFLKKKINDL
jgi:hypothetical protein